MCSFSVWVIKYRKCRFSSLGRLHKEGASSCQLRENSKNVETVTLIFASWFKKTKKCWPDYIALCLCLMSDDWWQKNLPEVATNTVLKML